MGLTGSAWDVKDSAVKKIPGGGDRSLNDPSCAARLERYVGS